MKPYVLIILLFILVPLTGIRAQFSTFDLSKYKTSDYERRILTFSGDISGNYTEDKSTSSRYDKAFNSNLNLDYDYLKNTRKIQQDFRFGFSLNPIRSQFNSSRDFSGYSKDEYSGSMGELILNLTNRFYFTEDRFFEVGAHGGFNASFSNDNTDESYDRKSFSSTVTVPVKFGFGRLENVEDARLAVFILEDMQKNQQLKKEVSDEDILLFAEKITQLKNKRHFDQRKRRIYEIQALDSFLRDNTFTSAQNALFFSSLMDNWSFANNPWRQAGKRFSIGVAPQLGYSTSNNLAFKSKNNIVGVDIFADAFASKPLSLKWQRDIRLKGGYVKNTNKQNFNYANDNFGDTDEKAISDNLYIACSFGYGFYPNTRTYLNLSINSKIEKNWIKWSPTSISNPSGYWQYDSDLRLDGYIYFSERLSLNYQLLAGYRGRDYEIGDSTSKNHNFNTSFNVSFAYSIF